MNTRTELLVADQPGMESFLRQLQREQMKGQLSQEMFAGILRDKMAKTGPRTKVHRGLKSILDTPEEVRDGVRRDA